MTPPTEITPGTAPAGHAEDYHRFRPTGAPADQDRRAALFNEAVERSFYEPLPTAAVMDQILELHRQDERVYLGAYDAGADPQAARPVGTFVTFIKGLHTGHGHLIPACLVSEVGVAPSHRRRGILNTMMRRELDQARADGLAVAALTASEATIYGRFGFGVATALRSVEVDVRPGFAVRSPAPGQVRLVEPSELETLGEQLYSAALRQTPGSVGRIASYRVRETDRLKSKNDGDEARGSGLFAAVHHDGDGRPRGYVTYRFAGWEQKTPEVKVEVLTATTADAYRGLWGFLGSLDLIEKVSWSMAPPDRLLEQLLTDPRRVETTHTEDHLWLRILDVPGAFASRRYAADGTFLLEVTDALGHAAGRWRLAVSGGAAAVERLGADADEDGAAPDLSLDVAELSSVWLGGVAPETLRQAGTVVEHRPGAAAGLGRVLAQDRAVHCMTGF